MNFARSGITLIRKIIVGVVGGTILLIGIVLIFIPGPAIIVIPIGLAILALEFRWANNLLKKFKRKINKDKQSD